MSEQVNVVKELSDLKAGVEKSLQEIVKEFGNVRKELDAVKKENEQIKKQIEILSKRVEIERSLRKSMMRMMLNLAKAKKKEEPKEEEKPKEEKPATVVAPAPAATPVAPAEAKSAVETPRPEAEINKAAPSDNDARLEIIRKFMKGEISLDDAVKEALKLVG